MTNTEKGRAGEFKVSAWLGSKGLECSKMPYQSPYDFWVNGHRCEIKCAPMSVKGEWRFNLHRHGALNESQVDFYILSLENVPFTKAAIHVIKKAPVGVPTIAISFRSLITRHAKDIDNLEEIRIPGTAPNKGQLIAQQSIQAEEILEGTEIYRSPADYLESLEDKEQAEV